MIVVKRHGGEEKFNKDKIIKAVLSAFQDVDKEITEEAQNIAQKIGDAVERHQRKKMTVEEIQDFVEDKLMKSSRKDVAQTYIRYRFLHKLARDEYKELMNAVGDKLTCKNIENQNANVDEHSFGGRIGAACDYLMKEYALNYCMSPLSRQNHLNNEIYIHDLNAYAVGEHNCLSVPLDKLLATGFNTRQIDVRPAQSINTAFQLVAVIFQIQSLQQFGGVSATHLDWTMVPYVRKSFRKHFKDGIFYMENTIGESKEKSDKMIDTFPKDVEMSIDSPEYKIFKKAYKYAMDMTIKETHQAVEGMYHNLEIWA
jgi:ribonucleoside-triphosphate reductase